MSARENPGSTPAPLAASDGRPQYTPGSRRGVLVARFASGTALSLEPGRARAYPGLRGEAPSMAAYYSAFAELVPAGRVLDAGSGSGAGARRLLAAGLSVVAVDSHAPAVEFARELARDATHVVADLGEFVSDQRLDGAIVADVLAHAADPDAVLLGIRRSLATDALVLVAEPAAHVSQRLTAPQRRGFSLPRLAALLVRTGFRVETVLSDGLPFVAVLARAVDPGIAESFTDAYALAASGEPAAAVNALDSASSRGHVDVEVELTLGKSELYFALGQGDAAAGAYFRARELAPKDARPLVGLGRIALASGDAHDALQLALDALSLDPTEAAACALAAVAADALQHPDAFTAWRAAVNLAPDDAGLALELARTASARGDHVLALWTLERFERYGVPNDPEYHVTRGWLLLAAGRREEAAVEVRIAHAKNADPEQLAELSRAVGK